MGDGHYHPEKKEYQQKKCYVIYQSLSCPGFTRNTLECVATYRTTCCFPREIFVLLDTLSVRHHRHDREHPNRHGQKLPTPVFGVRDLQNCSTCVVSGSEGLALQNADIENYSGCKRKGVFRMCVRIKHPMVKRGTFDYDMRSWYFGEGVFWKYSSLELQCIEEIRHTLLVFSNVTSKVSQSACSTGN